jgi:hypothetical protein
MARRHGVLVVGLAGPRGVSDLNDIPKTIDMNTSKRNAVFMAILADSRASS